MNYFGSKSILHSANMKRGFSSGTVISLSSDRAPSPFEKPNIPFVTLNLSIHIHKRESPEISKFYKSRFEGCGPPRKANKGSKERSFYVDCP